MNSNNLEGFTMKLQIALTGIVLAVFMSGCGSEKVGPAVNTGFFKNYETLQTQTAPSLKNYTKIQIAPIQVIPAIALEKQTASQKKMYEDIASYLNEGYKKIINASGEYTFTDKAGENTLLLESAISTVEVHFDDKEWNQLTPIAMGLDVISFNAYMYQYVRLLGEMRLVDATSGEVVARNLTILKENPILINGDDLELDNLKAGLDSWLEQVKTNIAK